jgi:hypothetical protein
MTDEWEPFFCFPSIIYQVDKPEFLSDLRAISLDYLAKPNCTPAPEGDFVRMTCDMAQDERIQGFAEYVAINALKCLADQGYQVADKAAVFSAMWCHEYKEHALMEQHVHSQCKLVGFYFLDAPDLFSARFYDPRPGKVASSVEEINLNNLTPASNILDVKAARGHLVLASSWLPHSFSKVIGPNVARFIHFNIDLIDNPNGCPVAPEVV